MAGLLHDFDCECYPSLDEHTIVGARILEKEEYPEDMIYAIRAHADYNHLDWDMLFSKIVFACDEISGFIMAVTMVRMTYVLDPNWGGAIIWSRIVKVKFILFNWSRLIKIKIRHIKSYGFN